MESQVVLWKGGEDAVGILFPQDLVSVVPWEESAWQALNWEVRTKQATLLQNQALCG